MRLNNGQLGGGQAGNSDANEIMDGVKTDDGDGDGAEKTADKDDLNDTKVDKNDKVEKEKKRQAFREAQLE